MKCPSCGYSFPLIVHTAKSRTHTRELSPDERALLSDDDLRAHYKRTSHIGDVRFFVGVCSPGVTRQAVALLCSAAEAGLDKTETLRQLACLQSQQWRARYAPANEAALWEALATYNASRIAAYLKTHPKDKGMPADILLQRADPSVRTHHNWPPMGVSLQSEVPHAS